MPLIAVISDIHADLLSDSLDAVLSGIYETVQQADILVFAGDISEDNAILEKTLLYFSFVPVKLFVPGNHDLWSTAPCGSYEKYTVTLPNLCKKTGWHFLPGNPYTEKKFGICGSCGFYDYSMRSPDFPEITDAEYAAKTFENRTWQDKLFFRWGPDNRQYSDSEITDYMFSAFKKDVSFLLNHKIRQWGAVFHHHAFSHTLPYRRIKSWDFWGAYMGAERFGTLCKNKKNCAFVIEGHSHSRSFIQESGMIICNSPLGYVREWPENLSPKMQGKNAVRLLNIPYP